jgi:magnesium-transporting ATPase (P-type)
MTCPPVTPGRLAPPTSRPSRGRHRHASRLTDHARPSRRDDPAAGRARRTPHRLDAGAGDRREQRALSRATEAAHRLERYGPNRLPEAAPDPVWLRLARHFNDVLIYVLLVAALLKAILGEWVDVGVIVAVAVANAVIGFAQEGAPSGPWRACARCCR